MAHETARVHTDRCARCGCDRKEQRRGKCRCMASGVLYGSHIWGWDEGIVAVDFYCERCREASSDHSYEPLCPDCYWERYHEEDRGGH